MKLFSRRAMLAFLFSLMLLAGASFGLSQSGDHANAAPGYVPAQVRQAEITQSGKVVRVQLLPVTAYTMVGANTPVTGAKFCIQGDARQFAAQLTLTGTMTGTAPTDQVILQDSIDGGVTWTNLNTFTTINATVTPAAQRIAFADVAASTAITFGDCFRVKEIFTGSGTVSANVGVSLLAK